MRTARMPFAPEAGCCAYAGNQPTIRTELERLKEPGIAGTSRLGQDVDALLQRLFPGQELSITRALSGGSTPVYRIKQGGEVFYLRLGEQPGERRDGEVRAHQTLQAAGLPMPDILIYESSPPELDRSATLTSAIPGSALVDTSVPDLPTLHAIAWAAGRDLARINQVRIQGFGWVENDPPRDSSHEFLGEHPTRKEWTYEYQVATDEIVTSGLFGATSARRLEQAVARWRALPDAKAGFLAHGDFDATHLFIDPSTYTYTGIIDFGEIRGTDRFYDLGHALLQEQQPDRISILPALLAGYREITPLPDNVNSEIRLQAIAIGVRQLAIFRHRDSPAIVGLTAQIERLLNP